MLRAAVAAVVFVLVVTSGCHRGFDPVRYKNAPIVTAVNDRKNTGEPAESYISNRLYHFDALVHRRVIDAARVRRPRRALDVNALGEVPDSTWFTNRISAREISIAELRRGPNRGPGPMAAKPWSVTRSKTTGVAPGFVFKDTAGDRYILKLDDPSYPEAESAAHVVVHRLLWALGYNVPEDRIVTFARGDLRIAGDAVVTDPFGRQQPMPADHVDSVLARAYRNPDGTYRALVTKFVPGKPVGSFAESGVRADDPNDTIAHQHRRVLRGLYPIVAWLKHTDLKPQNTLDAWVSDPNDPGRRYIRHYLIDFGKALGVLGRQSRIRSDGYARWLDFGDIGRSLITAGIYLREWEGLDSPHYRGLGIYQTRRYDPGTFESRTAWQPFVEAEPGDKFWGAKLIMHLSPAHIRAAVDEARLSDPRAREYLSRTLIERQRKTARYWFSRVNPIDHVSVAGRAGAIDVCFDDLLRRYRLASDAVLDSTRYAVTAYDYGGRPLGTAARVTIEPREKRICLLSLPTGQRRDGYTIVAVDTVRTGADYRPVLIHVALSPADRAPRVVGLRRL